MSIEAPYPELEELVTSVGEAGRRVSEIGASEGAAGNISIFIGWPIDPRRRFPDIENLKLPVAVPGLANKSLLITGSGRRLREIIDDPTANLGFLLIDANGETGKLYTSPRRLFAKLTSELNSHLAIHEDQVKKTETNFHALVHAQPPYLTYLSHTSVYQDEQYLNTHLLRWQPEAIVNLSEGIGVVPFKVPGSPELMEGTLTGLRTHNVVIWSKHGLISRSDLSVKRATDRIEYAETAAHYEYMNLVNHNLAEGLSPEEIREISARLGINQSIF
jgi:rhamnulose-1-phosphate aldolase